jgi:hypothetical protein
MLICACRANRRAWEGLTETWQGPSVEEQAGVVPASPRPGAGLAPVPGPGIAGPVRLATAGQGGGQ